MRRLRGAREDNANLSKTRQAERRLLKRRSVKKLRRAGWGRKIVLTTRGMLISASTFIRLSTQRRLKLRIRRICGEPSPSHSSIISIKIKR
jgi:hypothetical protein